jgi:hypothetical protein
MAKDENVDLTTLEGLVRAMDLADEPGYRGREAGTAEFRGTYCASCGASRRMLLTSLGGRTLQLLESGEIVPQSLPALYFATCRECRSGITVLVANGPEGPELIAIPRARGGLSTPNTPEPVSYYLDQAQRAQNVGAFSAAAAMYRSALDVFLYLHGFEQGTLGRKIEALEAADEQPQWFGRLDKTYLDVLNQIGTGAVHARGGDTERQKALDGDACLLLRELFVELLDLAYEDPERRGEHLTALQAVAKRLREDKGEAAEPAQ